jgi:hypothetical protein
MEKGVPDFNLYDKVVGTKGQVDLTLHFKQSSQSDFYYFPKYTVALVNGKPLEEGQKYMVVDPERKIEGKVSPYNFQNVTEAIERFKELKGNGELAMGKDMTNKTELAKMENGKVNYIARDFQRTFRMPAVDQTFFVDKGRGFSAEQAANLIEGRAVYRDDLIKLGGEQYQAWIRLEMDQPKDKYQNFTTTQYSVPAYGFVLKDVLDKYHIREMDTPEKAEKLQQALENGSRPLITALKDGQEIKLQLETSPRYRQLNFFQEDGKPERRESLLKEPLVEQQMKLEKGKGKEQEMSVSK